jgi:hypothetical protein
MDKTIRSLQQMLRENYNNIAELLYLSRHNIDESGSYGSRAHSVISKFEIISPPQQTASLAALREEEIKAIFRCALLLYPIKSDSPEITEISFKADPELSSEVEFVQYIDDEALIKDISNAIHLLQRKQPTFWKNWVDEGGDRPLEDDFRSAFYRMLGMKYQVSSEEESQDGRTDLILKSTSCNRKIFEFKVWKRNDWKDTSEQLLKYLTESDDSGFVIVANDKKTENVTEAEYNQVIESASFIKGSTYKSITEHGIEFYKASYNFNGVDKKVYHFILNL